mmetsp:Transcript_20943/g.58907  ORF Transcript_20943/g.58907 Transcript_20943/m.58907 type:complete len:260 (-) Transcript_20943:192-971(-)
MYPTAVLEAFSCFPKVRSVTSEMRVVKGTSVCFSTSSSSRDEKMTRLSELTVELPAVPACQSRSPSTITDSAGCSPEGVAPCPSRLWDTTSMARRMSVRLSGMPVRWFTLMRCSSTPVRRNLAAITFSRSCTGVSARMVTCEPGPMYLSSSCSISGMVDLQPTISTCSSRSAVFFDLSARRTSGRPAGGRPDRPLSAPSESAVRATSWGGASRWECFRAMSMSWSPSSSSRPGDGLNSTRPSRMIPHTTASGKPCFSSA